MTNVLAATAKQARAHRLDQNFNLHQQNCSSAQRGQPQRAVNTIQALHLASPNAGQALK